MKKVYWWQAVKRETDIVVSRARKIYCASTHLFLSEPNKYQIFWTGIKSVGRTRSFSMSECAGADNWLTNFQNLFRAYSNCLWELNAKMYKGFF